MTTNGRLVRKRRGARRRGKVKLLVQILVSCAFLGAALLLSAGIVKIVERPVAPWKVADEVPVVAQPAPVVVDEQSGTIKRETVDPIEQAAPVDPQHAQLILRETRVEDLAEAKR